MENENLKPVEKLTPFTKMIMTIGALPTSFYSSMSYYEAMVWLYEYLKNTVIPTVNNNGEAVEELQEKFIEFTGDITDEVGDFKDYINGKVEELETYMNNYFDNLDVQQEINNKLDAMALDGTLTALIKNYVDPIYEAYESEINQKVRNQDDEISSFKTSVNTQINNMNDTIASLSSGSPSGVYDTLLDLQTSDPDHSKIYLVLADGKWYYYNTSTSSWTAGGVYQAVDIDDGSVTINKLSPTLTNSIVKNYGTSINLFDTPTESGKYCYNNSGVIGYNTNAQFNYIKIELDSYSNYLYTGWNSSIINSVLVADGSDNILTSLTPPQSSKYDELFIDTGTDAKYLYFSYDNTQTSSYKIRNTLTHLIKVDKTMIINDSSITKAYTINDYLMQDSLISVDSVLTLNPIADPSTATLRINVYTLQAGTKYYIVGENHSSMNSIVITDLDNIVKYKSDISSTDVTYEFTPDYNGLAYLSYWETYTTAPTIQILDRYTELKNYVDNLPTEDLSNIKWGLLGDSITESNFRTTKNYWGYIQDKTNIQLDNVAVSGAGYKIYSPYNTYNQANNLSADDDFATIFAGINDIAWTSTPDIGNITDSVESGTILGYVNGTIDRVLNKFNYSKPIGIISPLPSCIQDVFQQPDYQGNLYPSAGNTTMEQFVDKLKELCEYRGIPFLDMFHDSGLQPQNATCRNNLFKAGSQYDADGLHPNALGHKFIYPRILEFIKEMIN